MLITHDEAKSLSYLAHSMTTPWQSNRAHQTTCRGTAPQHVSDGALSPTASCGATNQSSCWLKFTFQLCSCTETWTSPTQQLLWWPPRPH